MHLFTNRTATKNIILRYANRQQFTTYVFTIYEFTLLQVCTTEEYIYSIITEVHTSRRIMKEIPNTK